MARKRNRQKNAISPQSTNSKNASDTRCISMDAGENCSYGHETVGEKNPSSIISGCLVRKNSNTKTESEEKMAPGGCVAGEFLEDTPHLMEKTIKLSEVNRDGRFGGLIFSDMAELRHMWLSVLSIYKVAIEWAEHTVNRNLRMSASSLAKRTIEWVERKKAWFFMLTNLILKAWVNTRISMGQALPVFFSWLMLFGNMVLLVFLVWLDFAVRGFISFLCMGTVSFCSVIWFGLFSAIAMAGVLKIFMVMLAAALIGVFVGVFPAFLVFIVSGAILVWIYGSFWTTSIVLFLTGLAVFVKFGRLALLMMTVYSSYSAWTYTGYTGLFFCLNLSFISSEVLVYMLMSDVEDQRSSSPYVDGQSGSIPVGQTPTASSQNIAGQWVDRGPGTPSTSGGDSETSSEAEVSRLLNCPDNYSVLGFTRFENVDLSVLRREYRKKAMLVHPDKNMGNERAAEAFKKLQNAYEILHDVLKRRTYDDDLRRQDLMNCFQKFQNLCKKRERKGFESAGFSHFKGGVDGFGKSKRTPCKKCSASHLWILTNKHISRARWCQDCEDFHPCKHGQGWVEQFSRPLLFGLARKVDTPTTYICAESVIYDVTEWYICQGMKCPANTHKPSFHVKSRAPMKGENSGESMTEEEMLERMSDVMETGLFETPEKAATATATATTNPCAKECKSFQRRKKGRGGR